MAGSSESNPLSWWMKLWFIVSGIICTWDASFIVLRPHSMPGGKYFNIFAPYKIYIAVDKRYGDMNDTFVLAQSLMNYVEIVMGFLALYLSTQKSRSAVPLAFATAAFTFWKTVLYLLQYMDFVGGGEYHAHNSVMDNILFLYIPSGIWIVVPFLVMCSLWSRLANGPSADSSKKLR